MFLLALRLFSRLQVFINSSVNIFCCYLVTYPVLLIVLLLLIVILYVKNVS